MKTPEDIKKGLALCFPGTVAKYRCEKCPYIDLGLSVTECEAAVASDAVALIQQLEAENSRKDDTIGNLTELLNVAHDETERVMQELNECRWHEGETELEQ